MEPDVFRFIGHEHEAVLSQHAVKNWRQSRAEASPRCRFPHSRLLQLVPYFRFIHIFIASTSTLRFTIPQHNVSERYSR